MTARVLKSEAEYEAALAYIDTLMNAAPDSAEEEELSLFALLVEQYERENYPIGPLEPSDAIRFGWTRSVNERGLGAVYWQPKQGIRSAKPHGPERLTRSLRRP
jgi:HTH-type transcriptional regulator/antitoxin HigA